jgi:A/G-specific adenine glycosylase
VASHATLAVLVSEVMLHQTQVSRVLAAWPEFYGRFPTPGAMAHAGPGAVIRAWGTLGYPPGAAVVEAAAAIGAHGWPTT